MGTLATKISLTFATDVTSVKLGCERDTDEYTLTVPAVAVTLENSIAPTYVATVWQEP